MGLHWKANQSLRTQLGKACGTYKCGNASPSIQYIVEEVVAVNPFLGLGTSPAKVVKLESASLKKITTLTLSPIAGKNPDGVRSNMIFVGGKLFFGTLTSPPITPYLIRVNPETMAVEDTLALGVANANPISLEYIDPYIYVGCGYDPDSGLVKVTPDPLSVVSTLTLTGQRYLTSIEQISPYLYAVFRYSPTDRILEIDPATMSINRTLTLASGDENSNHLLYVEPYLYDLCTGRRLIKIDPVSFTRVSALTLPSGDEETHFMAYISPYMHIGCFKAPGRIVRVDLSTMTRVDHLDLQTGEDYVEELAYKPPYLYAITNTSPANLIKIDPATFTRVEPIDPPLAADEEYGWKVSVR